jgi:predicted nicotinamide N-methyase
LARTGPTQLPRREEPFEHGAYRWRLSLPRAAHELIDEREFERDERLPYWADLWPSARALARHLLDAPKLPERALELGCGIGLPSLALLARGVQVVASDYYEEALSFARENALGNGLGALETMVVDWRAASPVAERFPLVVGADLLYEPRNAELLALLLPRLVAPRGRTLLADPGRGPMGTLRARLVERGWSATVAAECEAENPPSASFAGTASGARVAVTIHALQAP